MTTRDETAASASDPKEWIDLRDEDGFTHARYNPGLHLLIIQRRGKKTIHDLRRYRQEERTPPAKITA